MPERDQLASNSDVIRRRIADNRAASAIENNGLFIVANGNVMGHIARREMAYHEMHDIDINNGDAPAREKPSNEAPPMKR